MARQYTNDISEVSASFPGTVYTPENRKNLAPDYDPITEAITVPAPDADGRCLVELAYAIRSAVEPVVTINGDVLVHTTYGAPVGSADVGISYTGVPILEFDPIREGQTGTIQYAPLSSVRSASFENQIQAEIVAVQEQIADGLSSDGTESDIFTINSNRIGHLGTLRFALDFGGPYDMDIVADADIGTFRFTYAGMTATLLAANAEFDGSLSSSYFSTNSGAFNGGSSNPTTLIIGAPTTGTTRTSLTVAAPTGGTTNLSASFAGSVLCSGSGATASRLAVGTSIIPSSGNALQVTGSGHLSTSLAIGTTATPVHPLQVVTTADTSGIQIQRSSTSTGAVALLGFRVSTSAHSTNTSDISVIRNSSSGNDMSFRVHDGTNPSVERMKIDGITGAVSFTNAIAVGGTSTFTGAATFTARPSMAGSTQDFFYLGPAGGTSLGSSYAIIFGVDEQRSLHWNLDHFELFGGRLQTQGLTVNALSGTSNSVSIDAPTSGTNRVSLTVAAPTGGTTNHAATFAGAVSISGHLSATSNSISGTHSSMFMIGELANSSTPELYFQDDQANYGIMSWASVGGIGFVFSDTVKAAGYKSSDGSTGTTTTKQWFDNDSMEHTQTFKDGLLIDWTVA